MPRAAWKVTVVPVLPVNTRNVSIWPPDAATTERPVPKLRTNSTVHAPTPTITSSRRTPQPITHRRRDERRGAAGAFQDDAGPPGHSAFAGPAGGVAGGSGGAGGSPGGGPGRRRAGLWRRRLWLHRHVLATPRPPKPLRS